jgi:hypothetical protein
MAFAGILMPPMVLYIRWIEALEMLKKQEAKFKNILK